MVGTTQHEAPVERNPIGVPFSMHFPGGGDMVFDESFLVSFLAFQFVFLHKHAFLVLLNLAN